MPPNLGWSVWSADFTSPTISQWNLSVQRQLGRSWVVTTSYVGSSSRHLQRLFNINAAGPGDGATERERRMIPSLGAITIAESSGSGTYHGLETTVEKRLSRGLQGSLSYTWSHSSTTSRNNPGPKATWSSRLGPTLRLQLRWEVFNATNHPSYGLPNANLGSADFGTIRTTVGAPRQMQSGVQLRF